MQYQAIIYSNYKYIDIFASRSGPISFQSADFTDVTLASEEVDPTLPCPRHENILSNSKSAKSLKS